MLTYREKSYDIFSLYFYYTLNKKNYRYTFYNPSWIHRKTSQGSRWVKATIQTMSRGNIYRKRGRQVENKGNTIHLSRYGIIASNFIRERKCPSPQESTASCKSTEHTVLGLKRYRIYVYYHV